MIRRFKTVSDSSETVSDNNNPYTKNVNLNCQKCKRNLCECEDKICSYAYKQYGMKRWVYGIIITVISLGLIVPFFSEAVCTIWFPDISLGINTWNQFVSIILGIVATVLSIVSLIMGFKNYEDGLDLHEKHIATLDKIQSISEDVSDVKGTLQRIGILSDIQNDTPSIPPKLKWEKEPEANI